MSAIMTHVTGVGIPPSFNTCIAIKSKTSRIKFSWWARSRRIWVVSKTWSSTHQTNGRWLRNSPTAKCSKERCQSLVTSIKIPTNTWLPCVTGGLCCHISCSFSFGFTLDPIKSLPPRVSNEKSMGLRAPNVFRNRQFWPMGNTTCMWTGFTAVGAHFAPPSSIPTTLPWHSTPNRVDDPWEHRCTRPPPL